MHFLGTKQVISAVIKVMKICWTLSLADVYAVVHINPSTTGEPTLNGKLKRGSDLLTVFQTMGYNLFS